jgi:hypothetical protein
MKKRSTKTRHRLPALVNPAATAAQSSSTEGEVGKHDTETAILPELETAAAQSHPLEQGEGENSQPIDGPNNDSQEQKSLPQSPRSATSKLV